MKSRKLPLLLTLGLISVPLGLSAEETQQQAQEQAGEPGTVFERAAESAGEYVAGAALTARVKTQLATESALSPFRVSVESTRGVVTLSGDVSSEAERRLAERVAADVEGVYAVHNALRIEAGAGEAQ